MDTLLKTAIKENVKDSSYKNYKSTTIKLFNLSNPILGIANKNTLKVKLAFLDPRTLLSSCFP